MPLVIVLVFLIICVFSSLGEKSAADWPTFGYAPESKTTILLAGLLPIASWLLAAAISSAFQKLLAGSAYTPSLRRRFDLACQGHFILLLTAYLALLFGCQWGSEIEVWCFERQLPISEIVIFAPFLAGLILSWERFGLFEQALFERVYGRDRQFRSWNALVLQTRHHLLLVLPFLFLRLIYRSMQLFLDGMSDIPEFILLIGPGLIALVCIPYLLRVFLNLKPMPANPLRERLEATAQRLGFRCKNILVWHTRHTLANAMVTGIFPWNRYVIFTDRIMHELEPDQLEAVFCHEVGHIKYHHMAVYFLFGSLSFLLIGAIGITIDQNLSPPLHDFFHDWPEFSAIHDVASKVISIMATGLYLFFVFGYLSRRCERQADLYGCRAVSNEAFISALERVAALNGISRDRPSLFSRWLHPTIAQRVAFLEETKYDPELERSYHFKLQLFKFAMLISLPCFVVAVMYFFPDKIFEMMK